MASIERDLEIGGITSGEDGANDRVNINIQACKSVNGALSGLLDFNDSHKGECGVGSASNVAKFSEITIENVELLIDKSLGDEESQEHVALLEKKLMDKHKKSNPYKPPRPPKGPALDVTDMKLVRELSELAMQKRVRIARVKALKKKRAAKASSSSSSLLAMIITLLFCLIIIYQGICSRGGSSSNFQGPHEPGAVASGEGLISVEYLKKLSPEEGSEPSFASLNLVEQISGSGPEEGASRLDG